MQKMYTGCPPLRTTNIDKPNNECTCFLCVYAIDSCPLRMLAVDGIVWPNSYAKFAPVMRDASAFYFRHCEKGRRGIGTDINRYGKNWFLHVHTSIFWDVLLQYYSRNCTKSSDKFSEYKMGIIIKFFIFSWCRSRYNQFFLPNVRLYRSTPSFSE